MENQIYICYAYCIISIYITDFNYKSHNRYNRYNNNDLTDLSRFICLVKYFIQIIV